MPRADVVDGHSEKKQGEHFVAGKGMVRGDLSDEGWDCGKTNTDDEVLAEPHATQTTLAAKSMAEDTNTPTVPPDRELPVRACPLPANENERPTTEVIVPNVDVLQVGSVANTEITRNVDDKPVKTEAGDAIKEPKLGASDVLRVEGKKQRSSFLSRLKSRMPKRRIRARLFRRKERHLLRRLNSQGPSYDVPANFEL